MLDASAGPSLAASARENAPEIGGVRDGHEVGEARHAGRGAELRLEPPGFMGLNYGYRTPLTTLLGQAVYGGVLGGLPQPQSALG